MEQMGETKTGEVCAKSCIQNESKPQKNTYPWPGLYFQRHVQF